MTTLNDCARLATLVREKSPLVHHLTNYVTVNDCANVTLAIGGSPIMAEDIEEAGEIAAISSALVINIGTLNTRTIASMIAAGKSANSKSIPVVLDPVGAGASALRTTTTARILHEVEIAVIRGNISEIRSVAGLASHTKGVDADNTDKNVDAGKLASELAGKLRCVIAITGAQDAVSDGTRTLFVDNGHDMLAKISGTGCMCTSLVGSFVGAAPTQPLAATAAAILSMGIAGEIAFEKTGALGLGSYHQAIMNAVSLMSGETILRMGKIHES